LRRQWEKRSIVTFGRSPEDYDEKLALLLLNSIHEDVPERYLYHEGYTSFEQALFADEDDFDLPSSRFPDIYVNTTSSGPTTSRYRELRRTFEEIYDDMDDFEEDYDSFPKQIRSLSPSVENQFTPDVMRSLPRVFSKLKQRRFRSRYVVLYFSFSIPICLY
jgi:hypothetical protein